MSDDIHCNEILYNEYKKIPQGERLLLQELAKKWKEKLPLSGKKVILNGHITQSTLIIVDLLLLAGAEVTVTATKELSVHKGIVDVLITAAKVEGAKLHYLSIDEIIKTTETTEPAQKKQNPYDIVLDCGAGLFKAGVKPNLGAVELTYTDPELYKNIAYPIVTVDQTDTKAIETNYGTGDGFIRALKESAVFKNLLEGSEVYKGRKKDLDNLQQSKEDSSDYGVCLKKTVDEHNFAGKKYIVFGYGKVGKGIAGNLAKAGVKPKDIVIIDPLMAACCRARFQGYTSMQLNADNLDQIKQYINKAFCVVTATGTEGCISKWFDNTDFLKGTIKVNMGTPDEWGPDFGDTDILNKKKAANFALDDYPTQVRYLDPIFTLLLRAAEDIVQNHADLGHKFQPLKSDIDVETIAAWQQAYSKYQTADSPLWENISNTNIKAYANRIKRSRSISPPKESSSNELPLRDWNREAGQPKQLFNPVGSPPRKFTRTASFDQQQLDEPGIMTTSTPTLKRPVLKVS